MLLLLLACSSLDATGDAGLVGRITDHEGEPVADLRISSVEGDARTDADGRFAVNWKAPEQHARFKWGPVSITRGYQPADAGRVVSLQLPEPRHATVACPPTPCDHVATRAHDDGFEATFRTRCKVAGASLEVPGLPTGEPTLTCTVGKGASARQLPLMASDQGDVLGFRPARTPVKIQVRGAKGPCDVRYGEEPATPDGKHYVVEAEAPAVVTAMCDGRPGRPVRVDPEVRDRVTVVWSQEGPAVEAPGGTLDLVSEADGGGWTVRLEERDGVRALPPLTDGRYRLIHLPPDTTQALLAAPPEGEAGRVMWAEQDDGSSVGRLVVKGPLPSGPVPVTAP